MVLIYPKSHVECRDSVFDGQINEENSKAALGMNLDLNWVQKLTINTLKQSQLLNKVQGYAMLIFLVNL